MHYQLTQELKTKKLNSLPKDLKKIAEEMVAEKFDLPAIEPKKKEEPELGDYPYQDYRITVRVFSRRSGAQRNCCLLFSLYDSDSFIMSRVSDSIRDLRRGIETIEGAPYLDVIIESNDGVRAKVENSIDVERFIRNMLSKLNKNAGWYPTTGWTTSTSAGTSPWRLTGMTTI